MNSKEKTIKMAINIGDQLTSISCGHVVVELVKFIAYQRLQIPYSYQWLKQIINKRKMRDEEHITESLQSERHFRVASTALENLDFILKSLLHEINSASLPEEVIISIGASPITSKEVYRFLLPTMCHKPQCQSTRIANDQKIQKNVFRELVTSDTLSHVFFSPLQPTNTFVFIKKKIHNQEVVLNHDNFIFTSGHRIPRSSKIIIIDFRSQDLGNVSCCNNFQVFGETVSELKKLNINDLCDKMDYHEIESSDTARWYRSTYVMKGFKDCFVNGESVTSSWTK